MSRRSAALGDTARALRAAGGTRSAGRGMSRWIAALGALAVLAASSPVRAGDVRDFLADLTARLEAAAAARRPTPPVPVAVRFRDRRLASLDVGAPLLALAGAPLDDSPGAELIVLTAREVLIVKPLASAPVLARAPLGGEPAAPRPRAPMGTLALEATPAGLAIVARSSDQADGVVLVLEGGALVARERRPGFPLCGGVAELVPGKARFAGDRMRWPGAPPLAVPAEFAAAACFTGLRDPLGYPRLASGVLDDAGRLALSCRGPDGPCPGPASGEALAAGTAFAVIDLDRDGAPELARTRASGPGDLDEVVVLDAGGERTRRRFHGGVVGLVAADLDGDGADELVAATRFLGSHQVTLWTLN